MSDWIDLQRFTVPIILGVLDSEQVTPQPVEIEISMGLDLQEAGDHDDLGATVDYAAVCDEVIFLARSGHWRLLETLALAVLRHLLAPPEPWMGRAPVDRAALALRKPTILGGRAVPGIRMERAAAWREVRTWSEEGVRVEVLARTEAVGAYRVVLQAGASWMAGAGVSLRVIRGAVHTERGALQAGEEATWSGEAHLVADAPVVLLAVARPPLGIGRPTA